MTDIHDRGETAQLVCARGTVFWEDEDALRHLLQRSAMPSKVTPYRYRIPPDVESGG